MATLRRETFLCYCWLFVLSAAATFVSDNILGDPCGQNCEKSYPSNSYTGWIKKCCKRGCRLYSIIELVGNYGDGANGTLKFCYDDCSNAYNGDKDSTAACIVGCRGQTPFSVNKEQMTDMDVTIPEMGMSHMFYPLIYIHNMYSKMLDHTTNQMCMSWSFLWDNGSGNVVVIRSRPLMDVQDFDDYSTYRGTSSVLETNIESADNTATEVLRHSQLKSVRSFGDEISAAETDRWKYKLDDGNSDWLTCIARKTGLPRLFLCMLILLSAVAMIWLCMSAAVTAPEHRISQKLSVQGDLDYLRYLPDKKGILGVHPQDFVEARPLPVKIRVEQI